MARRNHGAPSGVIRVIVPRYWPDCRSAADAPTKSLGRNTMYDAIVIGARCAGSPTAMLLARKGYRVLLLDRASFPSDSYRNHFIQHPGVVQLHRWGILDRVIASNCPPVRTITTDFG